MEKAISDQQGRADRLIGDLEKNKAALSALERTMLNRLDDQDKRIYALDLQKKGPQDLTIAQRDFLKEEAKRGAKEKPSPSNLIVQGYSEYLDGQYDRARASYSQALMLNPNTTELVDAYFGRARVDQRQANLLDASSDLSRVIELTTDKQLKASALELRADIHMQRNEIDAAEKDFSAAIELYDDKFKADNGRGFLNLIKKDWRAAKDNFMAAANDTSDSRFKVYALENIGLIYLAQQDWKTAYDWTQDVSKIYDAGGWNVMIQALAADKLGKPKERDEAVRNFVQRVLGAKDSVNRLAVYLPDDLAALATQWTHEQIK